MSEGILACDVCSKHGPGTGMLCSSGKPWDGDYRSWHEYSGMAAGWTVERPNTKQARPVCGACAERATCGPVNVDGDGRGVA